MSRTRKAHSPAHRRARHLRRVRRHCSVKHHRSPHRVSARTRKMHKKFCKRHRRKTARKHRRKTARKHHRRKSRRHRGGGLPAWTPGAYDWTPQERALGASG